MNRPALVAGPAAAIDDHHTCGAVLGGGAWNSTLAFNKVAWALEFDFRSQTLTIIGEDDRPTIADLAGPGGHSEFLYVSGYIRRNQIVLDADGVEHTTYGEGSIELDADDIARLLDKVSKAHPGSWAGLTGSLPKGMSIKFYLDAINVLHGLGIRVAIDTRGNLLKELLDLGCFPDIIFPNKAEAELLAGEGINPLDDDQLFRITSRLLPPKGAVVATLGPHGVFLNYKGRAWRIQGDLPPGHKIATWNGCGDSLFGATLAGLNSVGLKPTTAQVLWAICLGVAAAAANMGSPRPGEFEHELFLSILNHHLAVTRVRRRALRRRARWYAKQFCAFLRDRL